MPAPRFSKREPGFFALSEAADERRSWGVRALL